MVLKRETRLFFRKQFYATQNSKLSVLHSPPRPRTVAENIYPMQVYLWVPLPGGLPVARGWGLHSQKF